MKNFIIASAIAMCLCSNAFAEDDGYGNDIPPARQEGTVDDGYGNKLPAYGQQPEYKSFEEARKSSKSNNTTRSPLLFGLHLGIGYASMFDYPTDEDFIWEFGKDDWSGVSFDFGFVFKYRLNALFSFVPEVNFGMDYILEEYEGGGGYSREYGTWYKINESRTLFNINIPLALRLTVPFVYLEGGVRLNFNLTTSHDYEYTDLNGNALRYVDENHQLQDVKVSAGEWKVKTFVTSALAGLGTTMRINGHECDFGVRVIWDLVGVNDNDKLYYEIDVSKDETDGRKVYKVVENNSRFYSIQFIFNYFFG